LILPLLQLLARFVLKNFRFLRRLHYRLSRCPDIRRSTFVPLIHSVRSVKILAVSVAVPVGLDATFLLRHHILDTNFRSWTYTYWSLFRCSSHVVLLTFTFLHYWGERSLPWAVRCIPVLPDCRRFRCTFTGAGYLHTTYALFIRFGVFWWVFWRWPPTVVHIRCLFKFTVHLHVVPTRLTPVPRRWYVVHLRSHSVIPAFVPLLVCSICWCSFTCVVCYHLPFLYNRYVRLFMLRSVPTKRSCICSHRLPTRRYDHSVYACYTTIWQRCRWLQLFYTTLHLLFSFTPIVWCHSCDTTHWLRCVWTGVSCRPTLIPDIPVTLRLRTIRCSGLQNLPSLPHSVVDGCRLRFSWSTVGWCAIYRSLPFVLRPRFRYYVYHDVGWIPFTFLFVFDFVLLFEPVPSPFVPFLRFYVHSPPSTWRSFPTVANIYHLIYTISGLPSRGLAFTGHSDTFTIVHSTLFSLRHVVPSGRSDTTILYLLCCLNHDWFERSSLSVITVRR